MSTNADKATAIGLPKRTINRAPLPQRAQFYQKAASMLGAKLSKL